MDIVAGFIALIHFYVFLLESIFWLRPATMRIFGLTAAEAQTTRLLAFNQGFYNLFLAFGITMGCFLDFRAPSMGGRLLADFCILSVLGAGMVLWVSNPRSRRGAWIQMAPALIYFFLRFYLVP